VQVSPDGLSVAVYCVNTEPFGGGAVHVAVMDESPGVAVTEPGASGTPLHARGARIELRDTQLPSLTRTRGVTVVDEIGSEVAVPVRSVARVVEPSSIAYFAPPGTPPGGVHVIEQLPLATLETPTAVGR
jgi:hypothetical protein